MDLLLRSDHHTLPEEVLPRLLATSSVAARDAEPFKEFPPSLLPDDEKGRDWPYLVDRLAISLGNKHLGGWTGVDTIVNLVG